jgi:hypothetical protein
VPRPQNTPHRKNAEPSGACRRYSLADIRVDTEFSVGVNVKGI